MSQHTPSRAGRPGRWGALVPAQHTLSPTSCSELHACQTPDRCFSSQPSPTAALCERSLCFSTLALTDILGLPAVLTRPQLEQPAGSGGWPTGCAHTEAHGTALQRHAVCCSGSWCPPGSCAFRAWEGAGSSGVPVSEQQQQPRCWHGMLLLLHCMLPATLHLCRFFTCCS